MDLAIEYRNKDLLPDSIPQNASFATHLLVKKYSKLLIVIQHELREWINKSENDEDDNMNFETTLRHILEKYRVKGDNIDCLIDFIDNYETFSNSSITRLSLPIAFDYYLKFYASSKQLKFEEIGRGFKSNAVLFRALYKKKIEEKEQILKKLLVCTHMKDVQRYVDETFSSKLETNEIEEQEFFKCLRQLIESFENSKEKVRKTEKPRKDSKRDVDLILKCNATQNKKTSSYLRTAMSTLEKVFHIKQTDVVLADLHTVIELIQKSINNLEQNNSETDGSVDSEEIEEEEPEEQKDKKKRTQKYERDKQGQFQSKFLIHLTEEKNKVKKRNHIEDDSDTDGSKEVTEKESQVSKQKRQRTQKGRETGQGCNNQVEESEVAKITLSRYKPAKTGDDVKVEEQADSNNIIIIDSD